MHKDFTNRNSDNRSDSIQHNKRATRREDYAKLGAIGRIDIVFVTKSKI